MAPPLSAFADINVALTGAAPEVFSFGTPLGVFDHSATANRYDGPYTSVAEAVADGFTSGDEPEVHAWVSAMFPSGANAKKVDQVYIGRIDSEDADLTESLTEIDGALGAANYYGLNVETRAEASILLAAAFAEASSEDAPTLLIAQTADAAVLAGTAGNVALDLQALSYDRTALLYHRFSDSTEGAVPTDGYADAAWLTRCGSFRLDSPNGRGNWKYKTLSGVSHDPLTPAEAAAVWAADANIYGRTKGLSFTSNGRVASGLPIDVVTSLDWLRIRIGEAVLAEFVGADTTVAFTNAGSNQIASVVRRVYEQGLAFGHLSPDVQPSLTMPRIATVSEANKGLRKLTAAGAVVLAGSTEVFEFNLNVTQ